MKISVGVKPNSKLERIEKVSEKEFIVRVNVPPVDGRANERVIELLANFLQLPKTSIKLASGARSKKKVFVIS